MGGGFALLCAPQLRLRRLGANYGEVPGGCDGAAGRLMPDRGQLRAAGTEACVAGRGASSARCPSSGVEHDVKEYPGGRPQLHEPDPASARVWDPAAHLVGFDYHHPSAEDAWRRILTFFDHHLATGG